MKSLTDKPTWQQLEAHYQSIKDGSILDLFAAENDRFDRFTIEAPGLFCDYSKHFLDTKTLSLMAELLDGADLAGAIEHLFSGEIVNVSEQRAAWHTALRDPAPADESITSTLSKIREWSEAITAKTITDILHVGIGGSYLGPAVVYDAFASIQDPQIVCHFIADENQEALTRKLASLNPATTLVIVVSKSFGTAETIVNAERIKNWLRAASSDALQKQLVAVTASAEKAIEFGVSSDNIFPLWDWVGGRYSLWSAVSLSIAIAFGWDNFSELLSGAHAMDQHFRSKPWAQNLPVILGFLGVWYRNFFNAQTQAIIPYHAALRRLPAHLQQLHMESLGKRVTQSGEPIDYDTGAIIWGGVGPSSQHSFHQLLLQGNTCVPIDFIVTQEDRMPYINCLAQAAAMMQGNSSTESYRRISGDIPSTMMVMEKITPYAMGAMLAMYEHKVFVQSVIWDIDAFDQWGVESGKRIAKQLLSDDFDEAVDASTRGLKSLIL